MKLKNRKMISALVAAFMVVVLAGSAFAFGTGVLRFEGEVNIDTELRVDIHHNSTHLQTNPYVNVEIAEDLKSATITVGPGALRAPGCYFIASFWLVNRGTVYAQLSDPAITYTGNWDLVDVSYTTSGRLIPRGGQQRFDVTVTLEDFDYMRINETLEFTVVFNYSFAGL